MIRFGSGEDGIPRSPPRVSGILRRSRSTAMKMPPPGGTSSGSGGAGGTPGRLGGSSKSPSPHAHLEKNAGQQHEQGWKERMC